jgi:hypothetical protein
MVNGFFRFDLKICGYGFSRFGIKTDGYGFSGFYLKISGYSSYGLASKPLARVFQFGLQNRQLRFGDLAHKITTTVS